MASLSLFVILTLCWGTHRIFGDERKTFGFEIHHRFSDPVRRWWAERSGGESLPEKGTVEYYAHLAFRDRVFRGRRLSDADPTVSFSEGNGTFRINDLGFLHYAVVTLGTPSSTFLVALDTGSDLFWVPCDCLQCAPPVAGNVQTGSFLDAAAPNGLFGLGMEKISVPSILAKTGVISDSFSMCFGKDGLGRISFGDKGSSDQGETPFNVNQLHPSYNVSVTELRVGGTSVGANFDALVDSGTSFTCLADPAYSLLTEDFNSLARDERYMPDSKIPFDYCYLSSANKTASIPSISLSMKGGDEFPATGAIIFIPVNAGVVYCLGVVKSPNLNIIGQNFMTGLRIVFDRERLILGWKKFNCYDVEDSSTLPINPRNSSAPPVPSVGQNNYTPQATESNGNQTQVSVLPRPENHAPHEYSSFMNTLLIALLLIFIIL
ncbi:Aspartic proteinase-like protein 1 [Acorus gramineus]|uniref:Aspartic proteinase-like protein 1 n=1 Tax=Acorus gramineus TaxID=55184 RepID=A0AAV9ABY8_ACOGR|nr:Aspartic proteinase-like protein 1 [Acorus gramineus]